MSWTGTLKRLDLGTGGWALETGKERLVLMGDVPADLAGKRVEVHGKELDGASFVMAGKMIEVSSVRAA